MKETLYTNGIYSIVGETLGSSIQLRVFKIDWTKLPVQDRTFITHTVKHAGKLFEWVFGSYETRVLLAVNLLKGDIKSKIATTATKEIKGIAEREEVERILTKLSNQSEVE